MTKQEQGFKRLQDYENALAHTRAFVESVVIQHVGAAFYLQEDDGPTFNVIVFVDIPLSDRDQLIAEIVSHGGTFVDEYCIHDQTQLYIRRYQMDTFTVKVMVAKNVA